MQQHKLKPKSPIVWAIDPFETRTASRGPLAKTIKVLSEQLRSPVLPFSVLSLGGPDWLAPITFPSPEELRLLGEEAVTRQLNQLQLFEAKKSEIAFVESGSRREMVDAIIAFARKARAGCIAVNSRRLQAPLIPKLGAFAEAVLAKSPVPLLTVGPRARAPRKIRRILFPTDFTPRTQAAFDQTIELAKSLGAELHIVHVEMPLETPFAYPEMSLTVYEAYLEEAKKARELNHEEMAKLYLKAAKARKLRCFCAVIQGRDSVARTVLEAAKKRKIDIICLASCRNENTPALFGGNVREIMSVAHLPVLEFRC